MLKNIGNMGRGTARPDGPIDPSLVQLRRDRAFAEEVAKENEQQKKIVLLHKSCMPSVSKLKGSSVQEPRQKKASPSSKSGFPFVR